MTDNMNCEIAPAVDTCLTWEDLERASLWLDAQNQIIDSLDLTDLPADASPDDPCVPDDLTPENLCPAAGNDIPAMASSSPPSELLSSFSSSASSGSERTHRRLPSTDVALDAGDLRRLGYLGLGPPEQSVVPSPRRRSFTGLRSDGASPDLRSRTGSWFGSSPSKSDICGSAPVSVSGSPAGTKDRLVQPVRKERRRESLLKWLTKKPSKAVQMEQEEALGAQRKQPATEEAVVVAW